jgi:hypothetical protein
MEKFLSNFSASKPLLKQVSIKKLEIKGPNQLMFTWLKESFIDSCFSFVKDDIMMGTMCGAGEDFLF